MNAEEKINCIYYDLLGKSEPTKIEKNDFIKIIRALFRDMVETVAWLHKHKVCHMDISLENTILQNGDDKKDDENENMINVPCAKIMDFGLSIDFKRVKKQILSQKSLKKWQCNDRRGKDNYMPPEVYNKQIYDCRLVDVWCLGVCLFMVCVSLYLFVFVCVCVFVFVCFVCTCAVLFFCLLFSKRFSEKKKKIEPKKKKKIK